jgi:adenylylsulfate kinase-like enzyme
MIPEKPLSHGRRDAHASRMPFTPIPVLWLCGPAGVGKSTVSWQLYTELASSGVRVAFVDSDQICMCYPAPPADPGRQHLKALNAGAMLSNFRAAGAQCVIINGVLDPAGLETELMPDADVTICLLRARGDEIERRLTGKHSQWHDPGAVDRMLRMTRDEVRLMDQSSFADASVDTTGVPAGEVAALVRAACADWPGFTGDLPGDGGGGPVPAGPYPPATGRVTLVAGPAGVGKSTIAFRFYMNCLKAGLTAGYVDLRQIGFLRSPGEGDPDNQRLKARNLAAIWRNCQAAGATHLVAPGIIDDPADFQLYGERLTGANLAIVRLRAHPDELTRRILTRGAGGSWPEPGDLLRGQAADHLAELARRAGQHAEATDRSEHGGLAIDTTGRSPEESADLIADAVGWFIPAETPL